MRSILSFTLAVGLALTAIPALATDAPLSPLAAYKESTNFGMLMCKVTMQAEQAGDPDSSVLRCIEERKSESTALLPAALKSLKGVRAKDRLKLYHAAYVGAINGIKPAMDELRIAYTARQEAAKTRLAEAWTLVELEQ